MSKERNAKKVEFQNQRYKEKILTFIYENWTNPNDLVQVEDVASHLKKKYSELERKSEKELTKLVKWQFD